MSLARPPFAGRSCLAAVRGPHPLGPPPERARAEVVRTHDGVRLSTDVYLPPGRGPFAAVLCRLPYDKAGDHAWIPDVAARIVDLGFAFVAQDVRGKARSGGERLAFVHEAADGAATLDWIESRRWSNGRVGMWGQSYFGFTQWAAAATRHRALRCIVPQMTASEVGTQWMYRQGVFQLQTMAEWAAWAWTDARMWGVDVEWDRLPVSGLVSGWSGRPCPSYAAWTAAGPQAARWRSLTPTSRDIGRVRAAVLGVGGFWDVFQRGQVRDHLAARGATTRLRLAARDHFGSEWTPAGAEEPDYESDPALREEAVSRYLGPAPDWYDAWLRRGRAPAGASVEFQVAGEGWRSADAWPPRGSTALVLHLAPGRLERTPRRSQTCVLDCDPQDPVPSLDDNPWRPLFRPSDRRELERRPDVAVFDLELAEPLVLAGPASLHLQVTSTARRGHLHARLVDVWPGGPARLLGHGACVLTARGSATLDLGHVCCRVDAGRSLRLEVSGSDFPRYTRAGGPGPAVPATSLESSRLRFQTGERARLRLTTVAAREPTGRPNPA